MVRKVLPAFALSALLAGPAAAMPNPWTECGIGAMIFGQIPAPAGGILAAVSNIFFWDLGTTGTTSAVSTPSLCLGKDAGAASFLQDHTSVVEEQIAMGEGTHLNAVLDIYGCAPEAQQDLVDAWRTEATPLYLDPTWSSQSQTQQAQALWERLYTVVHAHPASCAV